MCNQCTYFFHVNSSRFFFQCRNIYRGSWASLDLEFTHGNQNLLFEASHQARYCIYTHSPEQPRISSKTGENRVCSVLGAIWGSALCSRAVHQSWWTAGWWKTRRSPVPRSQLEYNLQAALGISPAALQLLVIPSYTEADLSPGGL